MKNELVAKENGIAKHSNIIRKYGKKSADIIELKDSFFHENERHLANHLKIGDIYRAQPSRNKCKICEEALTSEYDFKSHNIEYSFCNNCNHLNGRYSDSTDFCNKSYTQDDGKEYSQNYDAENVEYFNNRAALIYKPKADFLISSLEKVNEDIKRLSFVDLGAGTGYFISALSKYSENVKGFEVSKKQVNQGNIFLNKKLLDQHDIGMTNTVIRESQANVISMIGVLEHLQDPRGALKAISENKNIKYFYFSVPLFSLSVILELLFQKGFNRQLGGTHTHLFSEESLSYICEEFGFEKIAEWWFGTDVVDLFRHGAVNLTQKNSSAKTIGIFSKVMKNNIDKIQMCLDETHNSSEVHMLVKKL